MTAEQRKTRPRASRGRGAAMVEMALVLPLLMLIILGCIDFGRFAYTWIAVANASRTGANFGAINPFTTATQAIWENQVRSHILADMASVADGNPASVETSAVRTVDTGGLWRVRVQVAYPFQTMVNWPGIPHQTTVRGMTEMRGIR